MCFQIIIDSPLGDCEMERWTVEDVCGWLQLSRIEGLTDDTVDSFRKGCVSGEALKHYTPEELRNDFPAIPPGVRKCILVHKDILQHGHLSKHHSHDIQGTGECSNERLTDTVDMGDIEDEMQLEEQKKETSTFCETFRPFDTCVDTLTFKYTQHSTFPHTERRPVDLLQPVRHLVNIDLNSKKFRTKNALSFAQETLSFVCACLNERSNGTIYFGVKENGEIQGTQLATSTVEFDNTINQILMQGFDDDEQTVIFGCVRPAKFIPVITKDDQKSVFVIEIDIVPKWEVCGEEEFSVKLPFKALSTNKVQYEQSKLFRFIDGKSEIVSGKGLVEFMKNKKRLSLMRRDKENELQRPSFDEELGQKLIDLLQIRANADLYPILIINTPGTVYDSVALKENFSFIQDIEWKAVIDFDNKGQIQKYLDNTEEQISRIIPTVNDLNIRAKENQNNIEKVKNLQDEIKTSEYLPWIFGNGFEPTYEANKSLLDWKRHQGEGFKEMVRFFADEIPDGRAVIVFLLLSKDYEIMLEAADDLCTAFQDQWVIIADSENVATPWMDQMQKKSISDKETIHDHSVIGLPWPHVQSILSQTNRPPTSGICQLPTSYGIPCPITERQKSDFSDLDILSATECDNAAIVSHPDELINFSKEVEEKFYRGSEVGWWNFWFDKTVLKRCKFNELCRKVKTSLSCREPDNNIVSLVNMYHHPGSGGTTTAKQVLWDLRRQYRCATVNNINERTCDQIFQLWSFQDSKPRAILLLLDNLDQEKVHMIVGQLEERGRRIMRDRTLDQVACVLLVVNRRSEMPRDNNYMKRMILENALTPKEQIWLKMTYKRLQDNHSKFKGTDPKFLISFNILKENFNEDFMIKTVREYTSDMVPKEKQLLRYVALINHFDANAQPVPSSAFDNMMIENPYKYGGLRYGRRAHQYRWENSLSTNIRVLLNDTTTKGMGVIKAFKIIHPLLSRHILDGLMSESDTISSIALEMLNNQDLFCVRNGARDHLLNIVQFLMTLRQRGPDGLHETKFAPLIQDILNNENSEAASQVMIKCFDLTGHPFVGQHLARLYIYEQNWVLAEIYAQKAINARPQNPHLWDTKAQVYKEQVKGVHEQYSKEKCVMTCEKGLKVVDLAFKAMDTFRNEQKVAQNDFLSYFTDHAGFHGEIEVIIHLLESLKFLEPFYEHFQKLHHFLVDSANVPDELKGWRDVEDIDYIHKLKMLQIDAKAVFGHLQDEQMQLKEVIADGVLKIPSIRQESIPKWKLALDKFFGEDTAAIPKHLTTEQQCQYRRRRLFRLGGNSLNSIFQLQFEEQGRDTLGQMKETVSQNICSEHCNAEDLQWSISINLALLSLDHDHYVYEFRFEETVDWSRQLYKLRNKLKTKQLEPFLFYILLNWPRKKVPTYETPNKIRDALRNWKEKYQEKYPRQNESRKPRRKKDTTTYFFTYGTGFNSFLNHNQLGEIKAVTDVEFWENPQVLIQFERFNGILSKEGNEVLVNIEYGNEHRDIIPIMTSYPINKHDWWNKTVYFVIGFR